MIAGENSTGDSDRQATPAPDDKLSPGRQNWGVCQQPGHHAEMALSLPVQIRKDGPDLTGLTAQSYLLL